MNSEASSRKEGLELARLVRLRRDDTLWKPSEVVTHFSGTRNGQEISASSQVSLINAGKHVLLSARVWELCEQLLSAVYSSEVPFGRVGQAEALVDRLIEQMATDPACALAEKDRLPFHLIAAGIRDAYTRFATAESSTAESIQEFYEHYMPRISKYAVVPAPPAPSFEGRAANVFPDAPFIEPLPKDGTKGYLLEREALRYGMDSIRYPNGAFVVNDPKSGKDLGFKWGRSPLASGVALSICSYKEATRRLLARVDVPVPSGRVFSIEARDLAIEYADRIGYPVVCKPVAGLRGIGVVAGIQNRDELIEALKLYEQSEMGADDFVIEEHVPGEDYRIVVIGGEVVASVVRAPASVTGDGLHTIADLIEHKNRARMENPHLSSRPIKLSDATRYQLSLAGLDYGSVPAPGQTVILANSANLSQGGDSFEVASEMHPSIKELAVKAVNAVPGLGFCGLDMLIEDHTKPTWEQRVTVIELNAHAAIGSAQYPMWGEPAPVAKCFFEETAREAGIELPEQRADSLSLKLTIRGRVTKVGYRRWLKRRAEAFGLTGYVKNVSDREVEAHVQGNADGVSAIGYLALTGPERAVPTSVKMVHAEAEGLQSFEIRASGRN